MGKYFELPFKQIVGNIRAVMLENKKAKMDINFSIEEFIVLQEFITGAFLYRKEKEQERLKFELKHVQSEIERARTESVLKEEQLKNEAFQATAKEQEKFMKIVNQVVHDVRSPLATMTMTLPQCDELSEKHRNVLNLAVDRIRDISNNLVTQFKSKEDMDDNHSKRAPGLICTDILEIITEKKYEYSKSRIDFVTDITQDGYFAFVNIDSRAFKRMLSNLINNAVEALENNVGKVIIYMDINDENQVRIIIEDNGNGMPDSIKDKILDKVRITAGKANGSGIGYGQIHDTLAANDGEIDIDSHVGVGTRVILTFPQVSKPRWICSSITLTSNDLIVVLDDDPSIHGAWELRFAKDAPDIMRKHFEQGIEAIECINKLSKEDKARVFLLTDYELLKQDVTGLDVVRETNVKRSVLVTSHHNKKEVRDLAKEVHTKILPKLLAAEVPIIISDNQVLANTPDLVIIDDETSFVETLVRYVFKNFQTESFNDPKSFLEQMTHYSLNTNILVTDKFNNSVINGISVLEELHQNGFKRLYLFATNEFVDDCTVPNHIRIIRKNDIEALENLIL